jgi:hypothetical protein
MSPFEISYVVGSVNSCWETAAFELIFMEPSSSELSGLGRSLVGEFKLKSASSDAASGSSSSSNRSAAKYCRQWVGIRCRLVINHTGIIVIRITKLDLFKVTVASESSHPSGSFVYV